MSGDQHNTTHAEHAPLWRDRFLDAIDGTLSAAQLQAVTEHLETCGFCQVEYRRLRRMDAHLRAEVPVRPVPDGAFDARLFERISAVETAAREAARLREQHDHKRRLSRLNRVWREFWRFNLGNILGGAAALIAVVATMLSKAETWSVRAVDTLRSVGQAPASDWSSLSIIAAALAALAVLALGLAKAGDTRLR